jgi:hypothetical protein
MDIIRKPMRRLKPLKPIKCIQRADCNCVNHNRIRKATAKRNQRRTPYPFGFEYKREII